MSTFLAVQKRGVISLPLKLRQRLGLDAPGAQLEVLERDGEIVLRPHLPIPTDQAWFWSPEWQAKEREVDVQRAAGNTTEFDDVEAFEAHLEKLDGECIV